VCSQDGRLLVHNRAEEEDRVEEEWEVREGRLLQLQGRPVNNPRTSVMKMPCFGTLHSGKVVCCILDCCAHVSSVVQLSARSGSRALVGFFVVPITLRINGDSNRNLHDFMTKVSLLKRELCTSLQIAYSFADLVDCPDLGPT